jgi:hypothetical protein
MEKGAKNNFKRVLLGRSRLLMILGFSMMEESKSTLILQKHNRQLW